MQKPLLSICIPTYNRPSTLSEALDSIITQLSSYSDIEVLVIDDGSDINTHAAVSGRQAKYPDQIRFLKNERNLGFDRNLLKCIEEAHGEYCWFMSDDDILEQGAIDVIMPILRERESKKFLLINYRKFDTKTKETLKERMISLNTDEKIGPFEKFFFKPTPNSYFTYLGRNLIYMSISIFPREYWARYSTSCSKYIDTNFIHLFILSAMLAKENLTVTFINEPFVLYRTGDQRIWPNHIWVTYHTKFLNFAKKLGLSYFKITNLQISYFITYRKSLTQHFARKILGLKNK